MVAAQGGINKLRENVDTLLVIPNEKLLSISEKPLTLCDAFELADSVLKDTICGISNIVYNCGNINIDYNDVKTTLENKGTPSRTFLVRNNLDRHNPNRLQG